MSEIIKGRISSYIYKSEDSLYKIARIISNNEEVIITGSFLDLEEGLEYEFVGEYVDHPKYGKGKVEQIQQNQDSIRLHIRFKEELKIIDQGWLLRTKYQKKS